MSEDNIKEFDDFLVGKASHEALNNKSNLKNMSSQLTGINSVSDLTNKEELITYEQEDDLHEFCPEITHELSSLEDYINIFIDNKKHIFNTFKYIEKKSEMMGNIPIKEKDLLLEDYDKHVINYLMNSDITDKFTVETIAKLIACVDLKITEFKFISLHDCSLCQAHDGLVMSIDFALNALCSGSYIIHPKCYCDIIPVIRRGNYIGPIKDNLNIDFRMNNINISSCPREYKNKVEEIINNNAFDKAYNDIEEILFSNMLTYYMNNIEGQLDNPDDMFAYYDEDKKTLVISNTYLANFGPADHFQNFIEVNKQTMSIDVNNIPADAEKFYISGKEVIFFDDKYWDPETGKQTK